MLLHEDIIYALDPIETSYIDFSDPNAKEPFGKKFNESWRDAVMSVINEYYDNEDVEEFLDCNPNPLHIVDIPNGFRAIFEPLYIIDNYDARAYVGEACDVLDDALNYIRYEFPDITFRGCIQFFWSDAHCGDVEKFDINVDDYYVHPYIGEVLKEAVRDDMFWSDIEESENIEKVKKDLLLYKDYLDRKSIERIKNL